MTFTKPVLFDLDSGEASGTVHFFCSTGCRSRSHYKLPDASNYGESDDYPDGTVCEVCGKPLDDDET